MANREFRDRLQQGESVIGAITNLDSLDLVEIIALSNYDFVLIDLEHSAIPEDKLGMMVRAAHHLGVPSLVRVRDDHPKTILRVCDLGVDGIMVPQIETADQAAAASQAMRYPPAGTRGMHPATPAARWGKIALDEHVKLQNSGICSLLQIETQAGVDNADGIAGAPGVDAVIVGPADLSQTMGFQGQPDHPEVEAATDRVFRSASQAGVCCGTVVASPERLMELRERGATFFLTGVLGPMSKSFSNHVAGLKAALNQ